MSDFFNFTIPWWVYAVPTGGGLLVGTVYLSRVVGVRRAIKISVAAAVVALIALSGKRGKQQGYKHRKEQEKEDAEAAIIEANDARRIAESQPVERLRDDDGFKRR